jgi:hypothetical protein
MIEKPVPRRRKKNVKRAIKPVNTSEPEQSVVPYDENLLERSRTQWQFGDWQSLAKLERTTLQHHIDRGKLALLAAAGHLQTGNTEAARQFIRLAQDWGCNKKTIAQVLVAGVHNSIGRAAAICGLHSRALNHIESSIVIGFPGSDRRLIAKARIGQQLEDLGLTPGSQGRLQQLKAISALQGTFISANIELEKPLKKANSNTFGFYQHLDDEAPFLLLDSKSLPRSGLHYLKNTLSRLLGDHFSFCEWYQEVGCCKQYPCALTAYALHAQKTRNFRLRLIKSHDFELGDPVYKPGKHLRRLVMVRDPLYTLTSWFALYQLDAHRDVLLQNGIDVRKLWLSHEKEMLGSAYRLLDEHFKEPTLDVLAGWLLEKSRYITGFMAKWAKPVLDAPERYTYLVNYEGIDTFIAKLIAEFSSSLGEGVRETVGKFSSMRGSTFRQRTDPFSVPSERVTEFIGKNAAIFQETVQGLRAGEHSQLFK